VFIHHWSDSSISRCAASESEVTSSICSEPQF